MIARGAFLCMPKYLFNVYSGGSAVSHSQEVSGGMSAVRKMALDELYAAVAANGAEGVNAPAIGSVTVHNGEGAITFTATLSLTELTID